MNQAYRSVRREQMFKMGRDCDIIRSHLSFSTWFLEFDIVPKTLATA